MPPIPSFGSSSDASPPTKFMGGFGGGAAPVAPSPMSSSPPSPPPEVADFLTKYLPAALQGNPYFEAGFGLSVVGTVLAMGRSGAKAGVNMAKRHFLVTLEGNR